MANFLTMESLMQLFNEWEIQLLVLISFTLQIFLCFSGDLRRRSTSKLRLFIWLAYLLADYVAVYALGLLSRQGTDDASWKTHQLMFFWTPFLLIHLGGQDTITAFSVEDNELWLRHLLNLLVQVGLALYVFWKSIMLTQLLLPTIFVYLAGTIKYGERIWALKCASLTSLNKKSPKLNELPKANDMSYYGIVCRALRAMLGVREIFAGKNLNQMVPKTRTAFVQDLSPGGVQKEFKMLEIELGMVYDDIYTKSMVFRTRRGAVLRCVAHISMVVAFVFFVTSSKRRYNRVDVAITYALFIGGFCLEVFAVSMVVLSPWTRGFLEARKWNRLACMSWRVFECVRPEKRPWWSNSMGQYNLLSSCLSDKSRSTLVTNIANALGIEKLWRNSRHTEHVDTDMELMGLVVQRLSSSEQPRPNPMLEDILRMPFEQTILVLHVFTDLRLIERRSADRHITDEASRLMGVCEKTSNYMLYLLIVHPFMLPVSGSVEDSLAEISSMIKDSPHTSKGDLIEGLDEPGHFLDPVYERAVGFFQDTRSLDFDAALVDLADMWVKLLLYAAGKSRADAHAKQLSRGGELLTFVWLLMAHREVGDVGKELQLVSPPKETFVVIFPRYAFNFL